MRTFMYSCEREYGATILKNIFAALREIEQVHIVRPSNCTVKCMLEKMFCPSTQSNTFNSITWSSKVMKTNQK